jgi:acyl transferase domain-containing protein/thioesterase domain-containing protein
MTRQDMDATIAVTGLACRFPGAPDADAFWNLLVEGREGLTRLTEDQLAEHGVPRRLRRDPSYVPVAGLIDGQDLFDPEPFGLAAEEAAVLDPQHRLFLECCWQALEQAGHGGGRDAGAVGVFAGAAQSAYLASNLFDRWDPTGGGADPAGSLQTAISTQIDYLPLQVAYRLDLTGPAVAVNTTCSTSLVAVHLAAQSLLSGECDSALAGGVSLIVPQGHGYLAFPDGIYSVDGKVRPFSALGTGIVYTQGAGAVVLRRLRTALDDGDPILALVHGSAVNNDGAAKAGFTAPSLRGQARVIAEALAVAGVDPGQVGHVEAHGTATRLGDPVEVAALRRVYGDGGPARCGLGSVKSNIGHANAAAGIASFIKTVLAVRHGMQPASLHAHPPNDLLGLAGSPFEVVNETRAWSGPPFAGVSSFGIGGTNAHVIVGPAPERPAAPPDTRPQPVILSAHSRRALEQTAAQLARSSAGNGSVDADMAYTLQVGRRHFAHRLALVSADGDDLGSALRTAAPVAAEPPPRVIFAFPGAGNQRAAMGAELYAAEPVFADCVDECAELLRAHLDLDIRSVIRGGDEAGAIAEQARSPRHGLPALFAVSLATARLLDSWGVRPNVVLGHSLGEYAAAVVSGALRLDDAARLVAVRCAGMAEAAGDGAMLAVPLGEAETLALLADHSEVDLAVVNAPRACVVSGTRAAVAALEADLLRAGQQPTRLRFAGGAHSRLVEPVLPRMRKAAAGLPAVPPAIPLISTLTGRPAGDELGTAEHWVRQLRQPVRFTAALRATVEAATGDGVASTASAVFVQVGPGAALAALTRGHELPGVRTVLTTLAAGDEESDVAAVRAAAGQLWAHGVDVDFTALHREGRRRVALPGYAFQRRRLWIDPPVRRRDVAGTVGEDEPDADDPLQIPVWRQVPPLNPVTRLAGRWLVVGGDSASTADVIKALSDAGAEAAPAGAAGVDHTEGAQEAAAWTGFVVLTTVEARHRHDPDAVSEGVLAHAELAKIIAADGQRPGFLLQVTRGAERVESADRPVPAGAALLALPRVIAQEQPGLRWRTLDLDSPADVVPAVLAELADLVAAPAAAPDASGAQVAIRGGARWVCGVTPWRPASAPEHGGGAAPASRDPRHRADPESDAPRPIALITGGLGDVGLTTAAHLARQGLRVVVTSRSGVPAQPEPGSRDDERAAALRHLAGQGLRIDVRRVDAADAAAVRALVRELAAEGPLSIVVHAAGVAATADLQPMRRVGGEQVTGHVQAKIAGALALRAALDDLPAARRPHTVVLMSSVGTLVGGIGMGPYCAANRFLDAFAEESAGDPSSATRWISVLWDSWKVDSTGGARTVQASFALDAATGMGALDRVLAARQAGSCPPAVAVSTMDLRSRMTAAANTPAVRPGGAAVADGRTELTAIEQTVAQLWSQLFGIEIASADADFFALGGHSLLATRMLAELRGRFAVDVRLRDLLARPTVAGLAALLADPGATDGMPAAARPGTPATSAPESIGGGPEPAADHGEPVVAADGTFPMTRVQHAYWVGRAGGYALGEIPCHFYLEYDCHGLDLTRYEAAWRKVIDRHPMLRAIVTRQGRLKVLDHLPPYRIRVHDLAAVDERARAERLARLRDRISRDPGPPDRWPLFQIQAARLPGDRVRLFIGVDVLICDAGSYWIIDREVRHFYDRPGSPLPDVAIDFAACVRALERRAVGTEWEQAKRYWQDRLDTLPGPPALPVTETAERPAFVRRGARLDAAAWTALREQAAGRGVTPTAVLLAAYAEALAAWSGSTHFAVTLTLFDRPPIHPDVDRVVGDFTSLLIHEVDRREPTTFAGYVRAVHDRLFGDLDNRAYSALELLADRSARTGQVDSVPVVFTSALGLEDLVGGDPDLEWVGEQVHAVSQTPQTWLDHQVLVQHGELLVQWDAVDGVLPADEVDRAFGEYVARLRGLAAEPAAWDRPSDGPPRGTRAGDTRQGATPVPTPGLAATATADDVAADADDILIPMRDGTGDQTIFLLHPSGGDVLCYAELSRLLDERFSVVAVADPGLLGGEAPADVAGLAGRYLDAIRRRRPRGPYLLGGWSMGGSLGQELACQLWDQGEVGELLLMFDANDPTYITPINAPTAADAEAETIVRLLGAIEAYVGVDLGVGTEAGRSATLALPPGERADEVARRLRERRLLGRGENVQDRIAVFDRHLRALAAHRPRRLPAERTATLLIRADRRASRNSGIGMGVDDAPPELTDLGWGRHLAGPLAVHGVDADHYSLLRPPAVTRLAELINDALIGDAAHEKSQRQGRPAP